MILAFAVDVDGHRRRRCFVTHIQKTAPKFDQFFNASRSKSNCIFGRPRTQTVRLVAIEVTKTMPSKILSHGVHIGIQIIPHGQNDTLGRLYLDSVDSIFLSISEIFVIVQHGIIRCSFKLNRSQHFSTGFMSAVTRLSGVHKHSAARGSGVQSRVPSFHFGQAKPVELILPAFSVNLKKPNIQFSEKSLISMVFSRFLQGGNIQCILTHSTFLPSLGFCYKLNASSKAL